MVIKMVQFYKFIGFIFLVIWIVGLINEETETEKPQKNPIAEKHEDFERNCEGLKKETLEADFNKIAVAQEQADMLKKRAKILYKQGQIPRFQYQAVKDRRVAIGTQYNKYYFCLYAKTEYLKAMQQARLAEL